MSTMKMPMLAMLVALIPPLGVHAETTAPVAPTVAAPTVAAPVTPTVAAPTVAAPVAPTVSAPTVASPVAPTVAAPTVAAPGVAAPTVAAPGVAAPPSPVAMLLSPYTVVGTYDVTGRNALDKSTYQGVVNVTQQGELYRVRYADNQQKLVGIGLLTGNTLAVAYASDRMPTILVMQPGERGAWNGFWAYGEDEFKSSENWTRR